MRDDLLDAQSSVDWAIAQIPIFQQKLAAWNARGPYLPDIEHDAQTGEYLLVAHLMGPLDPIVNAEVGVIVNSIRTALDLLSVSLGRRWTSKKPDRGSHFPIFDSEQEMIDPLRGIEGKKWLSQAQRATIKALRPYKGGDHTLWPLHQLDILRKHERLIAAIPDAGGFFFQGGSPGKGQMFVSGLRGIERLENKTILARFGGPGIPFDMTKGDAHVAAFVVFDEPKIGLADAEVAETLARFAARVSEIIKLFDF